MASNLHQVCIVLLVVAASGLAQSPPAIENFYNDELRRVNITKGVEPITMKCPTNLGEIIGISDRKNSRYVTRSTELNLDLSYRRGDYEDLMRMRSKLGAYHCIIRSAKVKAYSFVVSEVPLELELSKRIALNPGDDFKPSCPSSDLSNIVWERYEDGSGLFQPFATGISQLTVKFDDMMLNQSSGFTYYRCYSKAQPEAITYFESKKSSNLGIRTFQKTNYVSQLLPKMMRPEQQVQLECHGAVNKTAEFFMASDSKGGLLYEKINCSSINFTCVDNAASSKLTIKQFQPWHTGNYYCLRGGVTKRARVLGDYGNVKIREFRESIYDIGKFNMIRCNPTAKRFITSMFYVLIRKDKEPLKLKINDTVGGYKVRIEKYDAYGIKDITFRFDLASKKDAAEIDGARLECHLHYATDYTTLRLRLPKVGIKLVDDKPSYKAVACEVNPADKPGVMELWSINTTTGVKLKKIDLQDGQPPTGYVVMNSNQFKQLRCLFDYKKFIIKSDILPVGTPNVTVDIYIDGEKNPGSKALVRGQDVIVLCKFNNLPYQVFPVRERVRLMKNGMVLRNGAEQLNEKDFRFVLRSASEVNNGTYQCVHTQAPSLLRSKPLGGAFRSPLSDLSVCDSSQFICDGKCRNRSLLCDKKKDCMDGTDERPEQCSKCEPNAILCEPVNGTEPKRRCVLKHWLCDGQNDCGNGYDEDVSKHSKWCFKDPRCTGCKPSETCCPSNTSKCINRAFECDGENDCGGSPSEEASICKGDCLKITKPTVAKTITVRVGDPVNMTCVAQGTERPTINWRRNWAAVPKEGIQENNSVLSRDPSGPYQVEGKLSFTKVSKDMAGLYNCEAVNNCKRLMSYIINLVVND